MRVRRGKLYTIILVAVRFRATPGLAMIVAAARVVVLVRVGKIVIPQQIRVIRRCLAHSARVAHRVMMVSADARMDGFAPDAYFRFGWAAEVSADVFQLIKKRHTGAMLC